MPQPEPRWSGWRGVCLVVITYVYFLIFAQFAFLKQLASLGIAGTHLKAVMAAMATGGILLSLLAPRISLYSSPRLRLRAALAVCATAALLALLPLGFATSLFVAFLIGGGLGFLTVTLVTFLRFLLGTHYPLLGVGIGTGIGYLLCNLPLLFTASPQNQAITAAVLCFGGFLIAPDSPASHASTDGAEAPVTSRPPFPFPQALLCFTALVWLDSAAFFIIQNTPALKAGTWQGSLHLWNNGLLHLLAALASVFLLRHRGLGFVLSLAFASLGIACLLLLDPNRALLASFFYPVGVSLYSVALVAYPSMLGPAQSPAERGRQAGWLYAVAGWCGSAMGIGMGQNLGHVPPAFVLLAGMLILLPQLLTLLRKRSRELAATIAVLAIALSLNHIMRATHSAVAPLSQQERGRQVYIAEGCIHCHSQYVRPHTADTLLWGPALPIEALRRERPPLIGNRRQGPDLSEVGTRRSPLWLKAHFYNPSQVSHASFMPSYALLFHDHRGNDLVAYLHGLQAPAVPVTREHFVAQAAWHPSTQAVTQANAVQGAHLFEQHCATCHAPQGVTRQTWQTSFKRLPPNLNTGPFVYLKPADSPAQRASQLAQIIKFGLPGTDMPGHEYLSDTDIASLSSWLAQSGAPLHVNQQTGNATGVGK